jgi:hypothetical protein
LLPETRLLGELQRASSGVTIMDAFNKPGSSFASKCVTIVASSVDARYARLTFPYPTPPACTKAGEGPDGYTLFRRSSRAALSLARRPRSKRTPVFHRSKTVAACRA